MGLTLYSSVELYVSKTNVSQLLTCYFSMRDLVRLEIGSSRGSATWQDSGIHCTGMSPGPAKV
jgi:hypothetical protein